MSEELEEDTLLEFIVPEGEIGRLDAWLAAASDGFSRSRVQGLIKAGRMTINSQVCTKATEKVKAGDTIVLSIPPPVPAIPEPENIPLDIIFEDDDIVVIDKPAGIVVHPAPGHLTGTLVNALLYHCPTLAGIGGVARPGIVHRLDLDTSGVMIVAKSEKAMQVLTKEFASHQNVKKTYLALIHGKPNPLQGRIENLIGRSPYDRKKMAIVERNGKNAITNYKVISSSNGISLVECLIETGRTHQIRVHMASKGCPIVGDTTYGKSALDKSLSPIPQRQLLHAHKLELKHPITRKEMSFVSPIPNLFSQYIHQ
ncbi:MAG: RluA family pseudouridine synthase [Kiritimatiellae bacterium]|nr:RluA family pseudouridine synthase [Kiritimatiellia bacterium]